MPNYGDLQNPKARVIAIYGRHFSAGNLEMMFPNKNLMIFQEGTARVFKLNTN